MWHPMCFGPGPRNAVFCHFLVKGLSLRPIGGRKSVKYTHPQLTSCGPSQEEPLTLQRKGLCLQAKSGARPGNPQNKGRHLSSMKSEIQMRRTNAVRKTEEHIATNPFCAAHPDLATHTPRAVQSDPEEANISLRRSDPATPRAHPKADRAMLAKKRK
jgi:hypothetical protein